MMKVKEKILVSVIGISTIFLIANPIKSKAALQANPTTHETPVTKYGVQWITEIRQMETTGQTMGLNETLDGLNATSDENGIDVHMMLPTEWGAVAILSASGYGNQGKLLDETNPQKRTTTGNSTGVYFTGDRREILAGYTSATGRYYADPANFFGDTIGQTSSWHGGGVSNVWCNGAEQTYGPTAAIAGMSGLFSYGQLLSTRNWDSKGHFAWRNCWTNEFWNDHWAVAPGNSNGPCFSRGSAVLF